MVRVVARSAAQVPRAGLKTATGHYLFDLTHCLLAVLELRRPHEDRPILVQGQAGAIIEGVAALAHEPNLPLKMALLTNGLAQLGGQVTRIYDGPIRRLRPVRILAAAVHVQGARTVTAFTADPVAVKDGRAITVASVFNSFDLVGVAEQAGDFNRPLRGVRVRNRGTDPRHFSGCTN